MDVNARGSGWTSRLFTSIGARCSPRGEQKRHESGSNSRLITVLDGRAAGAVGDTRPREAATHLV